MRSFYILAIALVAACSHAAAPIAPASTSTAEQPQVLGTDTQLQTTTGIGVTGPKGWSVWQDASSITLVAPEGDVRIVIRETPETDPDAAVSVAWKLLDSTFSRPLLLTTTDHKQEGFDEIKRYSYESSPNEARIIAANALRRGSAWTIFLLDAHIATMEKRSAQASTIFHSVRPVDYARETFAGKAAHVLDEARLAKITELVEDVRQKLDVPGVAIGIVQNGKVVLARGFGVREIGSSAKVDEHTRFMIASNTKALTTLMLAKLVDEKRFTWDTQVTTIAPSFALGDADTTRRVLVKHLICACTGMPRQDLDWEFEFSKQTPASVMRLLSTMRPTTQFGEAYQYSNLMAAAAGYVAGSAVHPELEVGKAYDALMQSRVFDPLAMTDTTLDFAKGASGNHATPHSTDLAGTTRIIGNRINEAIVSARPAGGAWSTIADMLKYVQMELAEGVLPNGTRFVSQENLDARRAAQVRIGPDATYGMGLIVGTRYGTPVISHGGSLSGFKSQMVWLPEHHVGAVILTNADVGGVVSGAFNRRLLEVLFDGRDEARSQAASSIDAIMLSRAKARELVTNPPDSAAVAELAAKYTNEALGELRVVRQNGQVIFDVGEWRSSVATRKSPDGTTSFLMIDPGVGNFGFVVGKQNGKKTLTIRDAQHTYVFVSEG